MKAIKTFSMIVLALVFAAATLAAQTVPPEQAQQAEAAKAAALQASAVAAQQQANAVQQEAALKAQEEQRKQIEAERKKAEAERYEMEAVVKTYSLKYINPDELMKAAKFYAYEWTGTGSTITVRIPRKFVADFEAVLKKLDVEKKNIQFKVYTIVALKDTPADSIKSNFSAGTRDVTNPDLKAVLDQMKDLWNFKYYYVDNPSFLTVKDGAAGNSSKLVSGSLNLDCEMRIRNVELRGDEPGKRIISAGQIQLFQTTSDRGRVALIETSDITFKEKGYLVVGVSGMQGGPSGSALILVISAEVK